MNCTYCNLPVGFLLRPGAVNYLDKHESCYREHEAMERERTKHLCPCPYKRSLR